jgi:hypothetical protein
MEEITSAEIYMDFSKANRRSIQEDDAGNSLRCENLKTNKT